MTDCLACRYSSGGHCAFHPAPVVEKSEIEVLLDECDNAERDTTLWETEFLTSIRSQYKTRRTLSPRQRETLDKIHERLTKPGGDDDGLRADLDV